MEQKFVAFLGKFLPRKEAYVSMARRGGRESNVTWHGENPEKKKLYEPVDARARAVPAHCAWCSAQYAVGVRIASSFTVPSHTQLQLNNVELCVVTPGLESLASVFFA